MGGKCRVIPGKLRCSRCKGWKLVEEFLLVGETQRSKTCEQCRQNKSGEPVRRDPPVITTETVALLHHVWISKQPRVSYEHAMEQVAKGFCNELQGS